MPYSRRTVLKSAVASAAFSFLPIPGLSPLSLAVPTRERPLLIIVHLRGGADGLNFISPATDQDFIAARTSELRVASDGPGAGYALANGPDPRIDFRLHAAAGGLAELYQSGALAFIHAAGLIDGTRSHFVATDMIDRGVADAVSLTRIRDGWLTRYLQVELGATGQLVAASVAAAVGGEFLGWQNALAVPDLAGGLAPAGGPQARDVLTQLYAGAQDTASAAGRAALAATDHGRAGVMMVLGSRVKGGRFYGRWPGLANAQLDEGVDMAVATDYRQVLTEILRCRGADLTGHVFPGDAFPGPLGIFGA